MADKKKILNLYAGIGGNRRLWGEDYDVTAVEYEEDIAAIYKHYFPNDNVVVADAHQYLLDHYKEYDVIWASPPCPTHSAFALNMRRSRNLPISYPDMKLYQEIIFLKHIYQGVWIVENTKAYYEFLIQPTFFVGRHPFWSNVIIKDKEFRKLTWDTQTLESMGKIMQIDVRPFKTKGKRKMTLLRNCVLPEVGKYVLGEVMNEIYRRENKTELEDSTSVAEVC